MIQTMALKIISILSLSLLFSSLAIASSYYVCYQTRHDVKTSSGTYVKYNGCVKSYKPCSAYRERYFGEYSSRHAAENAYQRCIHNVPRFVD